MTSDRRKVSVPGRGRGKCSECCLLHAHTVYTHQHHHVVELSNMEGPRRADCAGQPSMVRLYDGAPLTLRLRPWVTSCKSLHFNEAAAVRAGCAKCTA